MTHVDIHGCARSGTSAAPFAYNEIYVVTNYGSGSWRGGDYKVDYTKINKLPTLRSGSVTNGQTAHGFIGYGCNMCEGNLDFQTIDPDTEHPLSPGPFGVVEVGWKVHT